jgi:hypothetical protein
MAQQLVIFTITTESQKKVTQRPGYPPAFFMKRPTQADALPNEGNSDPESYGKMQSAWARSGANLSMGF